MVNRTMSFSVDNTTLTLELIGYFHQHDGPGICAAVRGCQSLRCIAEAAIKAPGCFHPFSIGKTNCTCCDLTLLEVRARGLFHAITRGYRHMVHAHDYSALADRAPEVLTRLQAAECMQIGFKAYMMRRGEVTHPYGEWRFAKVIKLDIRQESVGGLVIYRLAGRDHITMYHRSGDEIICRIVQHPSIFWDTLVSLKNVVMSKIVITPISITTREQFDCIPNDVEDDIVHIKNCILANDCQHCWTEIHSHCREHIYPHYACPECRTVFNQRRVAFLKEAIRRTIVRDESPNVLAPHIARIVGFRPMMNFVNLVDPFNRKFVTVSGVELSISPWNVYVGLTQSAVSFTHETFINVILAIRLSSPELSRALMKFARDCPEIQVDLTPYAHIYPDSEDVTLDAHSLSSTSSVRQPTCVICLDAAPMLVMLPCKHMCVCEGCRMQPGDNCPMCRTPIGEIFKVFMS